MNAKTIAAELGCRVETVELEVLVQRGTLAKAGDAYAVANEAAFDDWKAAKRENYLISIAPPPPEEPLQ